MKKKDFLKKIDVYESVLTKIRNKHTIGGKSGVNEFDFSKSKINEQNLFRASITGEEFIKQKKEQYFKKIMDIEL